jgi:hypothetical protein
VKESINVAHRACLVIGILLLSVTSVSLADQSGTEGSRQPLQYRVDFRVDSNDPWQTYSRVRSKDKAEAIAKDVRESGYQVEVVNDLTPAPQPLPDAAATSASALYPNSNWAADYNYYNVPGGQANHSGWFGGYVPGYASRVYPGYAWSGGRSWHNGFWRGHNWNRGWNRGWNGAGWWGGGGWNGGGGWSGSHRNWNNSHADRGSHESHGERSGRHTHQSSHTHDATAGHHTAGHHAAAHHANNASGDHHGTGHHGAGARTAGNHGGAHHGTGGHHGGNGGAGHHSAGHSGRHQDP